MRPDLLGLCALESLEHSLLGVVVEHGPRVVREHLEAVANGLWLVVLPLDQVLAGLVVLAVNLGRVEQGVVHAARAGVDPTVLHAVNDRLFKY